MICARCLRRASRVNGSSLVSTTPVVRRSFASTNPTFDQQGLSMNKAQTSQPQRDIPAAISTSAAQPFSVRDTPSPANAGTPTKPDKPAKARPQSSVPGGTTLKGLNYFKNKEDPVAMEDHEYPDWLWNALSHKKEPLAGAKQESDPRLYSKSANARRMAGKRARKQASQGQAETRIPIFEQTVDLATQPSARNELTKAMRHQRREGIKEANFLRQMR